MSSPTADHSGSRVDRAGHDHPARIELDHELVVELRAALPDVAERTVAAVTTEVAEYDRQHLGPDMVRRIAAAVEIALATFLRASITSGDGERRDVRDHDHLERDQLTPALEAAYALGRGEAVTGRTMDALLAAYRVGARVAWQAQAARLVDRGVPAATIAVFAQLVFAYIDELSGASVAGHRDEIATTGRAREQLLERLAHGLLAGEAPEQLVHRAERAGWTPPDTLTVVLVASAHLANAAQLLGPRTLRLAGELAPDLPSDDLAVLLVADADRRALRAAVVGRGAVVGPTRRWTEAQVSYHRAVRGLELRTAGDEPLDTEEHLSRLVVTADGDALADLRRRVLAPLDDLRPATATRLADTLRSWLLHQGRRDEVAAELHVHPQTVRYRMTQLRQRYGDRLADPQVVVELVIALATPADEQGAAPAR